MNNELTKNLLFALGVENNEVIMCRLLRYLLMNKELFGLFMENVLAVSKYDKNKYRVYLEYPISQNKTDKIEIGKNKSNSTRRCDIVIETDVNDETYFYPIEVKLYAVDQPNQLYDYYKFFFNENKDENINNCKEKIYYLTINGKNPSSDSISAKSEEYELTSEQYKCISFEKNIIHSIKAWIEKCQDKVLVDEFLCGVIKQLDELLSYRAQFIENMLNENGMRKAEKSIQPDDFNNENYYNQIVAFIGNKKDVIYVGIDSKANVYLGSKTYNFKGRNQRKWPNEEGILWDFLKNENGTIINVALDSCINDCYKQLMKVLKSALGNEDDLVYSMVNYYE